MAPQNKNRRPDEIGFVLTRWIGSAVAGKAAREHVKPFRTPSMVGILSFCTYFFFLLAIVLFRGETVGYNVLCDFILNEYVKRVRSFPRRYRYCLSGQCCAQFVALTQAFSSLRESWF